jgi:hypothetical protein
MLLEPITWRANFCARKFISLVDFDTKIPNERVVSTTARSREPPAARSGPLVPREAEGLAVAALPSVVSRVSAHLPLFLNQ